MAKTGLYKSDVRKARDSHLAQSIYPSVDAVRVALGNTGSKTTIHKYLKELDEEEGSETRKSSVSDALLDLVERLAARLQDEADARVASVVADYADKESGRASVENQLKQELADAKARTKQLEAGIHAEAEAHAATRQTQQAEAIARRTAEQQISGLKERLAENEAHRGALEDKHARAPGPAVAGRLRQAQQAAAVKQEEVKKQQQ